MLYVSFILLKQLLDRFNKHTCMQKQTQTMNKKNVQKIKAETNKTHSVEPGNVIPDILDAVSPL